MGSLPFELKKREILIKKESDTGSKFGQKPSARDIEELINYGVVNIDKPEGPSSHQVSAYAKEILGIKKAGHSGTLDPKVTGVLPVALGNATRITQSLLTAGKEYVCLMRLHKEVDEQTIRKTMKKFVGRISQLPPIKSAVKRQYRYRKIYYIDIHEIEGKDVLFTTGVEAGTYIRKLCHDIGQKLGVGANMFELRRTKAGPFQEDTICSLQDLKDAFHFHKKGDDSYLKKLINPIEYAVKHLPKIWVLDTTVDTICHGASLKTPGITKLHSGIEPDMKVAVMSLKDELIMIAIAKLNSNKLLKLEKGVAARPEQVFMKPKTYPKIEKV
ncbi:RNA-guided pseudouridylation complex pseudouridine synthase subunit Cbf5 [Candidatus Woesearchaeota archaeon]|jgi:H/ACA ribonucleoprotein complex subunit 4|nr:RNA-guided pseudouridylation complex pseudouridine synthase subunit Cbf5 [Candidatus Woesearchaeota archaeon]|tara:strand:- start:487 stop:1473 length:987 start_codon:yes stop_codon:yes gene_type:complete